MTHVMLDLETWGKGPTASIISIGAVKFDPNVTSSPPWDRPRVEDQFYVAIDPESCEQFGLKIDASTMKWWFSSTQDAARKSWEADEKLDLPSALEGFADWFGDDKPVWGNGAAFDNVILGNAYRVIGMPQPWSYKSDRDFRTIKNLEFLLPIDTPEVGVAHNALSDALWQAHHLQNILACVGVTAR